MPKSKQPKRQRVAPVQIQDEPLRIEAAIPLVMEERNRLIEILNDPVFVKAWKNARTLKPSVYRGVFTGEHGPIAANNRLHEIRGWDAFGIAITAQCDEPKPKAPKLMENFPDSGTIDAAFQPSKT